MEREDPLERLARLEAEKKDKNPLKLIVIAMAIVVVGLGVTLFAILGAKNKLVGQLNEEKSDLTEQIIALQADYEGLSSDYDMINSQLDSSREEIAQLIDRVKKTEATNRSKIRQYEKELGTLRSIMRGYIVQIDSLNTLNRKLTAEAASARREAAASRKRNAELTEQVESLESKVSVGSILKARGARLEAFTSADKKTDRCTRVERMLVTVSLLENELAPRGPMTIYVRVSDPSGNLLNDGRNASFTLGEETLSATASREVDYQGAELELSVYINNIASYTKGVYTAQVYSEQALLGSAELLLR